MDALPFAPRRYACEPAVALAEKLAAITPGTLSKVLFTTGGSDAVEVAVKIARAATGRFKTLSFWDAFHGAGIGLGRDVGRGAVPLGAGRADGRGRAARRALRRLSAAPTARRRPEASGAGLRPHDRLRAGARPRRRGLVAEPTRAVPYIAPPGFWAEVRAICDRHGVLLIFDEIPTGLGKTGQHVLLRA